MIFPCWDINLSIDRGGRNVKDERSGMLIVGFVANMQEPLENQKRVSDIRKMITGMRVARENVCLIFP